MRTAIQKVLTDDGFNICSESAVKARETAEKLLEWSSETENQGEFASFASDLTLQLSNCFKPHPCLRRMRELMWEAFYKLRSSTKFHSMWSNFLAISIAVAPSPIFFQFVVDCVFDALIKHHYQVDVHEKEQLDISLTYEE